MFWGPIPSPICWNWPLASPSCFTPSVQQAAGGLDAMMELLGKRFGKVEGKGGGDCKARMSRERRVLNTGGSFEAS